MEGNDKNVPLGFPTNKDLLKKLDFISGTINTVEGITKKTWYRQTVHDRILGNIFDEIKKLRQIEDKSSFHFSKIRIENIIVKGDIKDVNIDNLQQVTYTLEAKDRKGNPAKVESVNWELTNPVVATLEVNPNNQLEATVKGISGTTGQTLVRATADVRFGEEVNNLVAEDALNVTDPEASVLSLSNSGAVDQ